MGKLIKKFYTAFLNYIGTRESVSLSAVVFFYSKLSLKELVLRTGITHKIQSQIRKVRYFTIHINKGSSVQLAPMIQNKWRGK